MPKIRIPQVGEIAPGFVLPTTDGRIIDLANYPLPTALMFFRHLA